MTVILLTFLLSGFYESDQLGRQRVRGRDRDSRYCCTAHRAVSRAVCCPTLSNTCTYWLHEQSFHFLSIFFDSILFYLILYSPPLSPLILLSLLPITPLFSPLTPAPVFAAPQSALELSAQEEQIDKLRAALALLAQKVQDSGPWFRLSSSSIDSDSDSLSDFDLFPLHCTCTGCRPSVILNRSISILLYCIKFHVCRCTCPVMWHNVM